MALWWIPVVLGFLAIYVLLPRPRPYPPLVGAALAGLSLVLAAVCLIQGGAADPETFLFYTFSAIAVLAGGSLVTHRNPVRAALSFALVVLSTCGLFLLQAAPFLMAATIIVYAGAIIVTFLFVIMLAQQAGLSSADFRSREPLLSCVAGFVLLGALLYVLHRDSEAQPAGLAPYDGRALANLLQRTKAATGKNTTAGIAETLQDESAFDEFHRAAQASRGVPGSRELARETELVKARWLTWKTADNSLAMRNALATLAKTGDKVLASHDDRDRARLPAANVASLGRVLFSEYLIPVEVGGLILLVATIGAIAIAGRRAEVLR